MVEDRLNGLAMIQIYQEIIRDIDKIIDKFDVENTHLKFI